MPESIKTKKIVQLVLAVIMLLVSGFIIYKNFTNDKAAKVLLGNLPVDRQNVKTFEKAIKVLEDVKFVNLIKFGNWPVAEGEKGRANPFIKL
ncbi:MAG: hypothetical protein PHT40_04280 [Patescibacteria group bacterium]|nr:hypothetical protein [Patescibacteria group bacterium]